MDHKENKERKLKEAFFELELIKLYKRVDELEKREKKSEEKIDFLENKIKEIIEIRERESLFQKQKEEQKKEDRPI